MTVPLRDVIDHILNIRDVIKKLLIVDSYRKCHKLKETRFQLQTYIQLQQWIYVLSWY